MIVNHDDSTAPGSHWVALYVRNATTVYYFDPFGDGPPAGPISNYLERFPKVVRNRCQFQPVNSIACGAYAIFVVYHLCFGVSFDRVLSMMCRAPNPDLLVRSFVDFIC